MKWKKGNNMLGYKIYFNGEKFVADNTATEVQTMPCDSTSFLFTLLLLVEKYFWQTNDERIWFTDRNMKAPCRCYSCRKKKH